MKIVLKASDLVHPLSMISSVINPKHFVTALANGLLISKDKKLIAVGSDGEIEIAAEISGAKLSGELNVLFQVRKLLDYLKFLKSDDDVTLDFQKDQVIVESSGDRFSINTLSGSEFPRLKAIEEGAEVFKSSLDRLALVNMIDKSMHAVAVNDMRQYLNGMLFEFQDNDFRVVGTDSHRLAFNSLSTEQKAPSTLQYIIPRKTAQELAKLLKVKSVAKDSEEKSGQGAVSIECSGEGIIISFDNHKVASKLINSQYPPYEKVIPKPDDKRITFDVESFRKMIQRASIVISDSSATSAIRLTFNGKEARAEAENNIAETLKTSGIEIESNLSEDFVISFNSRYLLDSFLQVETKMAVVYLYSSDKSILIEEENNPVRKFVLMPMKI